MITNIAQPPNLVYGAYWERGFDPFHASALSGVPEAGQLFSEDSLVKTPADGWMTIDHAGNEVGFVPDGTVIEKNDHEYIMRESYLGRLCAVPNISWARNAFNEQMKYLKAERNL
jgi:hypothetical protein